MMAVKNINSLETSTIEQRILKITNVLLINGRFTDNIGLLEGKMGIAIFFYNYARYTQKSIYNDYADDLIDDIFNDIHAGTSHNFSNGLTGIGWGIEYLIRNNFIKANADEVLEEIDNIILSARFSKLNLFRDNNELFGHEFYNLARLKTHSQDYAIQFPDLRDSLQYLINQCEAILSVQDSLHSNISSETLISILYFLSELQPYKEYSSQTEKIIKSTLTGYNTNKINSLSLIDNITLSDLVSSIATREIISPIQCMEIISQLANQQKHILPPSSQNILEELTKLSYYSLLYPVQYKLYKINSFITKAFQTINNEETWEQQVNFLNKENMSLRNGFAGLGLGLLKYKLPMPDTKEKINQYALN